MNTAMRLATSVLMAGSAAAMAAGSYDGIYSATSGPVSFLTVHQNENAVIAGEYHFVSSDGGTTFYNSGQAFRPSMFSEWDVYGGTISGDTATMKGTVLHGACDATYEARFTGDSLTVVLKAASTTESGAQQKYACGAVLPIGFTRLYKKVF